MAVWSARGNGGAVSTNHGASKIGGGADTYGARKLMVVVTHKQGECRSSITSHKLSGVYSQHRGNTQHRSVKSSVDTHHDAGVVSLETRIKVNQCEIL